MSESTNFKKSRFLVLEILVLVIIAIAYLLIYINKLDYLSGFSVDQFKRLLSKFDVWPLRNFFETYWMNILYIEFVLAVYSIGIVWGYLWKTRDRKLAEISIKEEFRRTLRHYSWLLVYLWVIYNGLEPFSVDCNDIKVHNTEFTPKDIINLYVFFPIYLGMGGGVYLYAKTRLPFFAQEESIIDSIAYPLSLGIGPLILFNAQIEWGSITWFLSTFASPWAFIYVSYRSFVKIYQKVQQEGISSSSK